MKRFIVRTPQSDRTALDVPESMSDLVANSTYSLNVTTGATLDSVYPVTLATTLGAIGGLHVIKVVNNTQPTAVNYEAIQIASWTASGGTITINYITGLNPSTSYTLTVVVYSA